MKQAMEFLKQNEETKSTRKPTTKLLPQEWVAGIFERMRLRYGHLWTKQIGEQRKQIQNHMEEWAKLLCSCSGEQIKHGLDVWDSEFPPNVYQFRTACKSINGRLPAHKIRPKALPKPPVSESTVLESLKKAREAIYG